MEVRAFPTVVLGAAATLSQCHGLAPIAKYLTPVSGDYEFAKNGMNIVNNTTIDIKDLLRTLIKQGIRLSVTQDKLLVEGNLQALDEEAKSLIKNNKNAIIDYVQSRKKAKASMLRKRPEGAESVLSFAQQRLWFIDQLDGGNSHQYNMPFALRLTGNLNREALQLALNQIVVRHHVLRSVYSTIDNGEARIRTMNAAPVSIAMVDLLNFDVEERERRVHDLALAEANKAFDLTKDMMLRVSLLAMTEQEHVLLFTMHHIASDGWSLGVLTHEFIALYEAYANDLDDPLPPLPIQYDDFAYWQRNWLQGEVLDQHLDFWLNQLADLPQVHSLPLDFPRPSVQSFDGSTHIQIFDKTLGDQLRALSLAHGATLFMTLQTAFSVLLSRYSNETDIVMGMPIANRTHEELSSLIGFFVNTLILRSDLSGNPSFSALLQKNKEMALRAFEHQHIPFEILVDKLRPDRSASHGSLYQIMFVLQNNEQTELQLPELRLSQIDTGHVVAKYDIHLGMEEFPDGLQATWTYCSSLFMPSTIERLSRHLEQLLRSIVAAPETPILQLPILSPVENHQGEMSCHGKRSEYQADRVLPTWFEANAAEYASMAAVRSGGQVLNYLALNQKANRLAHCLIESGVKPGSVVGVQATRSLELMVALLAIWKCRAAYCPFDPNSSTKRLSVIIADAGIEFVLVQANLRATVPVAGIDVLELDEVHADHWLAEYPDTNPSSDGIKTNPTDSAYIIYTSGSTGVPKGVEISHASLLDYCEFALRRYYSDGLSGSLVVTSHAFDITVPSLYLPLLKGEYVEFMPAHGELDALAARLQTTADAFLLRMTPLHAQALLNLLPPNTRHVAAHVFVVGGASFPPELARELQTTFPNSQIFNHYGPTEATVGCAIFDVTANLDRLNKSIPIGSPMDNTVLYVLNSALQIAPIGASGELYIGGVGLAKGYLNRPDLTAERFTKNPFSADKYDRLYRSGDLVRRLADGNLEYLGRTDDQVKIRGFRIELQEIEHQLRSDSRISQAVMVAREGVDGEKRLVAYVVPAEICNHDILITQLFTVLRQELPDYMVPSSIIVLNEMPLSANGKVDKRKLPDPSTSAMQTIIPPATPTEHQLAKFWNELLNVPCDSVTSSFFELGGHSLLVTRLISIINRVFSVNLKIADIFSHSSIRELAALIDAASPSVSMHIPCISREITLPLSFAQQRLWFIDRMSGGNQYNMPFAFRLTGELNRGALQRALDTIVARHEILRSVYQTQDNGEAYAVIRPAHAVSISEIDLSQLEEKERQVRVQSIAAADAMQPFDLAEDLMLRVSLLTLTQQEYVLLFTMHHIASDGWSMGVLTKEMTTLYEAFASGLESPLPPLSVQYADFAHWQRHWLTGEVLQQQLSYWTNQLANLPSVHSLPMDFPRSSVTQLSGAVHTQQLDKALSERLHELSLKHGATLFMTLQTAFAILIARYSNQTDVVMGTPIANRTQLELSPLIGFFVNTLVLRSDLSGNPTFSDLLKQNKLMLLQAYEHQHIPFEMLVDELQPERSLQHSPLFQIMFTLQTNEQSELALSGLKLETIEQEQLSAKFDLTLALRESDLGLQINWEFCTELFDAKSIAHMAEAFAELLASIVSTPDHSVYALPLLSADIERQILSELAKVKYEQIRNGSSEATHAFLASAASPADTEIQCYILDKNLQLLPVGVAGELYIDVKPGSQAYANHSACGAEHFVRNPFSDDPEALLYKTGDQVRRHPKGHFEYLGRMDTLVELHGVYFNLYAVEVALSTCEGVREVVVIPRPLAQGEEHLVAYLVAEEGASLSSDALRRQLAEQLPSAMVPSVFVTLKALPLTSAGKLDRDALPLPVDGGIQQQEFELPQGDMEQKLAELWCEVLNITQIARQDNFFAIGGSSLSAVRLEFAIREKFNVEISLRELFEYAELSAQAQLINDKEHQIVLPAIERLPAYDAPLALSFAQQRLWVIDQLSPGGTQYNMPTALHLKGQLDIAALRDALDAIVTRHQVLRTVYAVSESGEPYQRVLESQSAPYTFVDLRSSPKESREQRIRELANIEADKPFDLQHDLMLRLCVLMLDEEEHVLLLTMHHIASDGWSRNVLIQEFAELYSALHDGKQSSLPELPLQYADFAHWQRNWLQGETLDKQLNYWLKQLSDLPPVHSLPLDSPRQSVQNFSGAVHHQRFSKRVYEQLQALSAAEGATLFMTLQTAFAILLARYSGAHDVVMGTPIANRTQPELSPLIGFFVNTLVLRSDLSGNPGFTTLLRQNKQMALQAYEHQHIPFEMLVEKLQPERSFSHSPLFQIMFTLQSSQEQAELTLPDLSLQLLEPEQLAAKFDLTLVLEENEEGLQAVWEYCTELFSAQTVTCMADAFAALLSGIAAHPEFPIQRLPLLSEPEQQKLMKNGQCLLAAQQHQHCMHQQFEEQAKQAPKAIAVIDGEEQLSYEALNQRANRLAHYLIECGARPKQRIGLCANQSTDLVTALLAILKVGAAYVPLDTDSSTEQNAYILSDAEISIVLTQRAYEKRLLFPAAHVHLIDDTERYASFSAENPSSAAINAHDLAAVMYSPSPIGKPTGCMIEHQSVVNLVTDQHFVELNNAVVFLQLAPLSYHAAITEIWGSLLNGGCLVCCSAAPVNMQALTQQINRHHVNSAMLTPTLFSEFSHLNETCPGLRWLLVGGDTIDLDAVTRVYQKHSALQVVHVFGQTETTSVTSYFVVPRDAAPNDALNMGSLIQGVRAYVLSEDYVLQSPCAAGELYLAGQALARGYHKFERLTSDRFVSDPFLETREQRMYRTGIKARWSADGRLEFLGHVGHYATVDGQRVDCEAVESMLNAHTCVKQAALVAIGAPKQLVAYVVASSDIALGNVALVEELRVYLRGRLPEHWVPSSIIVVTHLPTTLGGELDRNALLNRTDGVQSQATYQAPQGEHERAIALLWAELFALPRVSRNENFFAIGGSSLSAVRLSFALQEQFGLEVSLREIFECPSVSAQARLISTKKQLAMLPAITAVARDDRPLPLSFAQQRLWFIDQLTQGSAQYNMPIALTLSGELRVEALHRAFNELVQRHEVLRTVYVSSKDGEAGQLVLADVELPLTTIDLRELPEISQQAEVLRLATEDASQAFQLERDLMLRITLVRLSENAHVLLLCMHHIASDGWSMSVLLDEFVQLYSAYSQGQLNPLPPLAIQYADFAVWQRANLQGEYLGAQLAYWQKQLADVPPVHSLRLDKPRPLQPSFIGKVHVDSLNANLMQQLNELAHANGATLFMVMHAAFAALIGRWSREEDIVIGTPIAGRTRKESAPLIGFFVNNLVLRSNVKGQQSFVEFLQSSMETVLGAFEHQEVPFEMLVDRFCPERNLNHAPLFQILFSLQNQMPKAIPLPGLDISGVAREQTVAKFDLSVQVGQSEESYDIEWNYSTDIFDAETIASLAEHYVLLLQSIVAEPNKPLNQLSLLTETDKRFYSKNASRAADKLQPMVCLHQRFEQQALRWPNSAALIHENQRLSYRELNEKSNRLAAHLRSLGVRTGDFVGLFLNRSLDMVVSILGVLKAGAAYVPMDPHNPAARTQHMVDDAGVSLIISHLHLQPQLPATSAQILHLDAPEHTQSINACSALDLSPTTTGVTSSHAAYIIYTSGSTGKPKGVVVEHGHVMRLFSSSEEHFSFDHNDCWTLFHSYAFDFSVWEIWGALLYGGRLVVVPYATSRSAADFYQLLRTEKVTVLNQTPSAFYLLIEQVQQPADLLSLRYVVFGGEALDPPRLRPWLAQFNDEQPQLINMYGITETTVHVTYRKIHAVDTHSPMSVIGVPLKDLVCHVCNEAMSLQPIGAPGELFVGGGGVSRGYLNRPELNRERFIENPFVSSSERLYRTGDLVRWTSSGELEYLGRIDHQAKLRGFRIELGEIEHELLNSSLLKECVVLIKGENGSEQQLIAYVVPNEDTEQLPNLLRNFLLGVLPPYMVPSAFVTIERIPLTDNGKIDRRALFLLTETRLARADYVAPSTPIESQLCSVWQDVLQLERVGVNDNFFAVGGDSIRVVQIVKRAEALGVTLDVKDIFLHQTIAELAELHQRRGSRMPVEPPPLHLLTQELDPTPFVDEAVEDCYPVTSMQQRMLEQHGTHGLDLAVYQPRIIYDIEGIVLDPILLETVLCHLINKHPVLRTQFVRTESGAYIQRVLKSVSYRLPVLDLSLLDAAAQQDAVEEMVENDRPFTLDESGIRFTLLIYGEQRYGLFISAHHAIIDGWAFVELRNEMMALYQQISMASSPLTTPLSSNVFKEHVALEREAKHSESHQQAWRELLEDYRPMPALKEASSNANDLSALTLSVDAVLVENLKKLAKQQHVTLKILLLLAYQRALAHILDADTITIDVVSSGRSSRLSDPLGAIGLFWSLLPVCDRVTTHPSDEDAIAKVAQKLLLMDSHSLYPVASICELVNVESVTYAAFNYVNFHNARTGSGNTDVPASTDLKVRYASDRFAYAIKLAISGDDREGDIQGNIEFDRRFFALKQVEAIRDGFLAALKRLVESKESNSDASFKHYQHAIAEEMVHE